MICFNNCFLIHFCNELIHQTQGRGECWKVWDMGGTRNIEITELAMPARSLR